MITILRVARSMALSHAGDAREEDALKHNFKHLMWYFQGEEGKSSLSSNLANGSDTITEDDFDAAFMPYIKSLAGVEATAEVAEPEPELEAEEGTPQKEQKPKKPKKPKVDKKKLKQQEKARKQAAELHEGDDSDDEHHAESSMDVPAGALEMLRYLAKGKPTARSLRDGPRGLAAALYMAVEKELPHTIGATLILHPTEAANMCAYMCF